MNATVRVMRSYDYNHFEITLTEECADVLAVNELRRQAAILVDEAIREYKRFKDTELKRDDAERETRAMLDKVERIKALPKNEWTPEQAALIMANEDKAFWANWEKQSQDYWDYENDDPDKEYHFSMLRKFKDTRVSAAQSKVARKSKAKRNGRR